MTILAIPNFGNRISPRIDYAENLNLITIENHEVIKKERIKILVQSHLERINIIIRINPDIVICNGISDLTLNKLKEKNIKVIPWISGTIDEIVQDFLDNKLESSKIV